MNQNERGRAFVGERSITFFQVGNGNSTLLKIDDLTIVLDLHGTDDKSSLELLKPFLPKRNGKLHLDVLCISHGDKDHCGGFPDLKKEMDEGRLTIGSIWHPNYNRVKIEGKKDLPEDYLALHEEILRRRKVKNPGYGDLEVPLTAWDDESVAFKGLTLPTDFLVRCLSPYVKDEGDTDWDVNDISLVLNVEVSGLSILFPGDSGGAIWQERIIPYTLNDKDRADWAEADMLVASHHGSFSFFGTDREAVRDADPYPDNYGALDYIKPGLLIVSAGSRFPNSRDKSGDQPPHYAAWKWYHKWFRDNHDVKEDDKHPECFKYTADGHLRLEHDGTQWNWNTGWSPDDGGGYDGNNKNESAKSVGFIYKGGETKRGGDHYA